MVIYPAIDLRRGRCLRLRHQKPNEVSIFDEDPVAAAKYWVAQGAQWLHVTNLDDSLESVSTGGRPSAMVRRLNNANEGLPATTLPPNLQSLEQICAAVSVPIQFGGYIRTLEAVELAFEAGVERVVLTSATVRDPEVIRQAVDRWGREHIVVSIHARNGKAVMAGRPEIDAIDLAHHLKCLGVRRILYADIDSEGQPSAVDVDRIANIGDMTDLMVIADGRLSALFDIRQLKQHEHYNIEGVIVRETPDGGPFDLSAAIEIGSGPLICHSAGLVPYRQGEQGIEFLLLWNNFNEQWQFPRGIVEEGERVLTCALREFSRETGLTATTLHDDVRTVLKYVTHIRNYDVERVVTYYLANAGPGEVVLGHDNHGDYQWVSFEDARMMLIDTSPEQLPALEQAMAFFNGQRGK